MKKIAKNIVMTIAIPVITYVFFFVACNLWGAEGFGVGADFTTIIYTTLYTGLIALAMSYNLTCGRFDYSVGSVIILSAIIGGNLAKENHWGPWPMFFTIVVIAMILGLISGLAYVLIKIPPMVVSIGITMIYEAFGLLYNRAKGIKMIGNPALIFAKPPYSYLIVGVALVILIFLFNFTKFGYQWRMLRSGQKISVDIGINEKKNAVICYVIAGALLGVAAAMYLSKYGMMSPEVGLTSSTFFMSAFLPLFIGGAIEKYSDKNIGVMIGAFTQAIITAGFGKLGFSSSLQTVLNGVIVMAFLVYTSNAHKFVIAKLHKAKLARAIAASKQ